MGWNLCDGLKVVLNIFCIFREIDCCYCVLVVKRGMNSFKVLFYVLEVFEFWYFEFCWMVVVLGFKFGVVRWDIWFMNWKFIFIVSFLIWFGLLCFGYCYWDCWGFMKMVLFYWEDVVFISECLVINDFGFFCFFVIVYICLFKWLILLLSWVIWFLSVFLIIVVVDSILLLLLCIWYNKKRISRNWKVFI